VSWIALKETSLFPCRFSAIHFEARVAFRRHNDLWWNFRITNRNESPYTSFFQWHRP